MIYLGIDPGAKGAVGLLAHTHYQGGDLLVDKQRVTLGRNEDFRWLSGGDNNSMDVASGEVDLLAVYDLPPSRPGLMAVLRAVASGNVLDTFAALERPGYGPPMGKSAAIKLRESFERCAMALVAAGIPFEEVSPQEWKKMLFKGTEIKKGKEGKAQARARAAELFPSLADQLSRVKDDGRAEALLLAEYARRLRAQ